MTEHIQSTYLTLTQTSISASSVFACPARKSTQWIKIRGNNLVWAKQQTQTFQERGSLLRRREPLLLTCEGPRKRHPCHGRSFSFQTTWYRAPHLHVIPNAKYVYIYTGNKTIPKINCTPHAPKGYHCWYCWKTLGRDRLSLNPEQPLEINHSGFTHVNNIPILFQAAALFGWGFFM